MFVSSLTVFVMADAAADHSRLRLLCPQWQGAGTESIRLFVEGDNLGALNLYATVPDAFTDDDESVGLLLAAHAAIAMKATVTTSTCGPPWSTGTSSGRPRASSWSG
jgi:GAF domain-containing protein